jgi:two-component system, OmpR family, alkaline phosphatase synthesis response regulator PhoP
MAHEHILVVDDEPDLLELIRYNLAQHGYEVTCALSGEEALTQLEARSPDLVILDLMLPGADGLEICRAMKRDTRTAIIPIIILSARGEEADVVAGLELGADDYLTKPFSPRVLQARIKAVLRRQQTDTTEEDSTVISRGDLVIHPGRHEVTLGGQPVPLTSTEFRILCLLVRRPGWVFSRQQIIEAAPGHDASVTERSVDVHIVSLRRKLGASGQAIETIRGVGYRFKEEEA